MVTAQSFFVVILTFYSSLLRSSDWFTRAKLQQPQEQCYPILPVCTCGVLELPHTCETSQPRHRHHDIGVAVACHSTLHVRAILFKWQVVGDAYESWSTTSHFSSSPFPISAAIGLAVISMEVYFLHWISYMEVCILDASSLSIQFNFVWPFLNLRALCGPPFCQQSVPAVVQAVIGCDRATHYAKWDRSYHFHTCHMQPLHSRVMLCGMALNLHVGKIPQNPCGFTVAWHTAVAVAYVCGGPERFHARLLGYW